MASVSCPICGIDPENDPECQHLFCHGDDLSTYELVNIAGIIIDMDHLDTMINEFELPSDAYSLLNTNTKELTALANVDESSWGGGEPGLSGAYCFVWVTNKNKFREELRQFLKAKIQGI